MIVRRAIAILLVAAACSAAAMGEPDPVANVTGALEAPLEVALPAGGGPVRLALVVSLTNSGPEPVTLTAPTPCDVHLWTVRDAGGKAVQSKPPQACAQMIEERELGPGETLREPAAIELLSERLVAGAGYSIRYRFWGVALQTAFTARAP